MNEYEASFELGLFVLLLVYYRLDAALNPSVCGIVPFKQMDIYNGLIRKLDLAMDLTCLINFITGLYFTSTYTYIQVHYTHTDTYLLTDTENNTQTNSILFDFHTNILNY